VTIHQNFLDELLRRTPLPSLIGRRIRLTRSGKNWKGCCPFHGEKTPSFYVYEDHFHCFGCGVHGNAIDYTMRTEDVPFPEAVERLAAKIGLPVPTSEPALIAVEDDRFDRQMVEAGMATAARLLLRQNAVRAAMFLANARARFRCLHDYNDVLQWELSLLIPADVYAELGEKDSLEREMGRALTAAMSGVAPDQEIFAKIVPALESDVEWRRKVGQYAAGEGITNQGRVRSDNVASREHDGLLFRSQPEIYFYEALKAAGVPFAPLAVVLHGGFTYKRVEPDFLIFRYGRLMIVEIDGDLWHRETLPAAHARLKLLTDEGATLERIDAAACDTPEKAREAVAQVLATMDKQRRAR
jgi:hypothetical protein